jgi:hypothetical protein
VSAACEPVLAALPVCRFHRRGRKSPNAIRILLFLIFDQRRRRENS